MTTLDQKPPSTHQPAKTNLRPGAVHRLGEHADIRLTTHGSAPITVALTGEIDLACADELTAHLCATLDAYPQGMELDLAAVTFCDCRGLAAMLTAQIKARHLGRHFALGPHSPIVARLLDLTGARSALTTSH